MNTATDKAASATARLRDQAAAAARNATLPAPLPLPDFMHAGELYGSAGSFHWKGADPDQALAILAACIAVGIGALMIHELERNSYPAPSVAPITEGGN